jgi:hypothetical protein
VIDYADEVSCSVVVRVTSARGGNGYARATALLNEQFGEEDCEAWRAQAPDEPYPSLTDEEM